MINKIKRIFDSSPFFVSGRTHFKFVRRGAQWLIRFCQPIATLFAKFSKLFPFWGNVMKIIDTSFDLFAFGTNNANGHVAQSFSFLGYGLLLTLSIIGLVVGTTAHLPFVTSLSVILGLYFEAVTLLNWFDNYKALERQQQSGQLDNIDALNNANTMVNAAAITFTSMIFKGFAISIGLVFPTAGITLFVLAQTAELTAMIGSIGKETVNIKQNTETLKTAIIESDNEWVKGSFGKIFQLCPANQKEQKLLEQIADEEKLATDNKTAVAIIKSVDEEDVPAVSHALQSITA